MPVPEPANAADVGKIVDERLGALVKDPGVNEALNVEWRGEQKSVPVITMPLALLSFNPDTHRVRAQRTLDPARDQVLTDAPYSEAAQKYLSDLLRWDPADPDRRSTRRLTA